MIRAFDAFSLPLLRWFDPEDAHRMAIQGLRLLPPVKPRTDDQKLAVRAFGLNFPNPIGMAAGFDKSAEAPDALLRLGFGFVEIGTVTPKPQVGNPRPRLFRLERDEAVINRMGFNNGGLAAYAIRLAALPRPLPAVFGANIGINKEGADPERDYPALYAAVAPHADYVTVNISSPNTPGLRDLQGEERLAAILDAIAATRAGLPRTPPVLVKIAPDLAAEALAPIVNACLARGVAGIIVSNTTIARPASLRGAAKGEAGGLSGAPLLAPSTEVLRQVARIARGRLVLVGVGGVASGADALAKIKAGASLVQLYTGFAYGGPALLRRIKDELAALLTREGFASVADAVGVEA